MSDRDEDFDNLQSHVSALCEHFDSVQIFVTRHRGESDETVSASMGAGNWFARYGQVKEWVVKEEKRAALSVEYPCDEEDEDESYRGDEAE